MTMMSNCCRCHQVKIVNAGIRIGIMKNTLSEEDLDILDKFSMVLTELS
jgi:hypothetical protein